MCVCVVVRIFYFIFHRSRCYINAQLTAHLARARHEEACERANRTNERTNERTRSQAPRKSSTSFEFDSLPVRRESRSKAKAFVGTRFRQSRRYLSAKSVVGNARSRMQGTEGRSSPVRHDAYCAIATLVLAVRTPRSFPASVLRETLPSFVFRNNACAPGVPLALLLDLSVRLKHCIPKFKLSRIR